MPMHGCEETCAETRNRRLLWGLTFTNMALTDRFFLSSSPHSLQTPLSSRLHPRLILQPKPPPCVPLMQSPHGRGQRVNRHRPAATTDQLDHPRRVYVVAVSDSAGAAHEGTKAQILAMNWVVQRNQTCVTVAESSGRGLESWPGWHPCPWVRLDHTHKQIGTCLGRCCYADWWLGLQEGFHWPGALAWFHWPVDLGIFKCNCSKKKFHFLIHFQTCRAR